MLTLEVAVSISFCHNAVEVATHANKASIWVGTSVWWLSIDVWVQLLNRFDFLELGYRASTRNEVWRTRHGSRTW